MKIFFITPFTNSNICAIIYLHHKIKEADMPDLTHTTCVCFTGHRSIEPEKAGIITTMLEQTLHTLIRHGATCFYAGGALGFDTISALTVLRLKRTYPHIKLCLILPCKNQTKMWSNTDRAVYDGILAKADSAEYVGETYTSHCMHDRNRRLVDSSDICIAYCEHNGGGTAYTMAYALKSGKELVNIADLI